MFTGRSGRQEYQIVVVLFLVLFWRRSRGCTALWLSSLRATDAVSHSRTSAIRARLLVTSWSVLPSVAAAAPRCLCIRFREHLTHTSFPDAVVPLRTAQPPRYA